MSNIPRAKIEELITRYDLEPTLKDIYVEGFFDRDVIRKQCFENKIDDVVVYEIGGVEIGGDLLDKYNLTSGNKQRVIALASELSVITKKVEYICLVDKDLDHYFDDFPNIPRLYWTKYCSLELYFFSEEFIKELVIYTLVAKIENWTIFYQSFIIVLKSLYLCRLADFELGLNMKWVDIEKSLSPRGSALFLDLEDYINKSLNSSSKWGDRDSFLEKYQEWNAKITQTDPRMFIRGHDFVDLIIFVVKRFRGTKEFCNDASIGRLFVNSSNRIEDVILSLA
jgi:hypothetical protein